jgi:subtilisin family serine protease
MVAVLAVAIAVPLSVFGAKSVAPVTELTPDWVSADAASQASSMLPEPKSVADIARETAWHEIGQARALGLVSVLVHLDPAPSPGLDARMNVRAFALANNGVVKHEYHTVLPHVVNLRHLPQERLEALANVPGVVRVELDAYHPDLVRLHDSTPLIRGLQSQITGAGYTADGAGVRVCVADTGIDSDHLMYTDRIDASAGYDFYNNDNDPEDDNGHGSHVAGIAVGGLGLSWDPCGTGSMPFQGVAPAATLIGAKILNQFGGGYDSDIIAGIDHCADQSASGGRADVINLSIGIGQYSGPCTHSWAVAANNAVANGVVVVAASGNENYSNALSSPACGVDVMAIGMTWKNDYPTCEDPTTNWNWGVCTDYGPQTDEIGCFSNESDYLDVAAPGANIWSASNSAGGGSITGKSGTSMSSPQVAGLAALVLGMDPSLTPAEVRLIIRDGAIDMGPAGFDRAYGHGRIDVLDTLALVGPQCSVPADCDDSDPCTIDDCVDGSCSNTPIDCDDSNACTTDYCSGGICYNDPITCDDGDLCTTDTCDAGSGCVYTPIDCLPGEVCVDGTCVPQVCNDNGTCDAGEDCHNCPGDCFQGSGAVCGNGVCETADGEDCESCAGDCNGVLTGRPSGRYCCGNSGTYGVTCADSRCTGSGNTCTTLPAVSSCCGDDVCEGTEDVGNCAVDCGCTSPTECDDSNECTLDDCAGGVCENSPVADDTSCSGGICCGGSCDAPVCSLDVDCDDGESCTTDTCYNWDTCSAYCDSSWPACGPADGCCGPGCDSSDPDCDSCVPSGGYCTSNADCCSNSCHPAKDYCR